MRPRLCSRGRKGKYITPEKRKKAKCRSVFIPGITGSAFDECFYRMAYRIVYTNLFN